jgi:hypothetical protein
MIFFVSSDKLRLKLGLQKNRNVEEIAAWTTRKLLMRIMNGVCEVTVISAVQHFGLFL